MEFAATGCRKFAGTRRAVSYGTASTTTLSLMDSTRGLGPSSPSLPETAPDRASREFSAAMKTG
jgi:hypothetical protein